MIQRVQVQVNLRGLFSGCSIEWGLCSTGSVGGSISDRVSSTCGSKDLELDLTTFFSEYCLKILSTWQQIILGIGRTWLLGQSP